MCFEVPMKPDLMALVRAQQKALDFDRLQLRWQLRLTAGLRRTSATHSVDFKRSESLRELSSTLTEQSNSEDDFSVCRSFMPRCQRCHFRLKASVHGTENNIRRYRISILNECQTSLL